jgi:cysteine-rich secretory family protein
VTLTNGERSSRGLRRLSMASDLSSIAERHSRSMAGQHRIYHDSNLPYEVSGWRALGENVGRGSSARSIHRAFMSSSTHRAHILGTRYNQIGVGAVRGSDNLLYVTEVFAARGSTPTRVVRRPAVRRHTVHRATHHRPARRVRATPARTAPVFTIPCRSVGILIELLALDDPGPAPKYIHTARPPP